MRSGLLRGRPRPDLSRPRCEERHRQAQCDSRSAPATASDRQRRVRRQALDFCCARGNDVFATTASNTTSATGAQRDNANTAGPPNLSGAHPSGMTISARTDPEVPLPTTLFHGGATSVETGILKPSVCCGNAAVRGCHRGEICSVDINRRAQTQLGTGKVFIRACRGEVAVAGAAAGIEERTASVVARAGVSSTTQSPIAIVIPRRRTLDPCARSPHPVFRRNGSGTLGANYTIQPRLRNSGPAK